MKCRFSVEAKTFSFSAISGKAVLRLEEKRKRFGGFILLGGKGSVWLADKVEEAIGDPKKGEFASSFSDEERVLKLRMGSDRCQILFTRPPLLMFVRLLAALITNILYSFWYLVLCRSLQQTWRAKGKNVDLK
jgi:hypothetical protein